MSGKTGKTGKTGRGVYLIVIPSAARDLRFFEV
jgi:hypothetical protein